MKGTGDLYICLDQRWWGNHHLFDEGIFPRPPCDPGPRITQGWMPGLCQAEEVPHGSACAKKERLCVETVAITHYTYWCISDSN
ncbi:hypothetical protein JZ751_027329, partial [Albula glossodonta]